MYVDQSVDQVDFGRVELLREFAPPSPERDRRLKLVGTPPGEGVIPLLKFGQHFPQLGLPAQEFGHGAHRHMFVLVVEERNQTG